MTRILTRSAPEHARTTNFMAFSAFFMNRHVHVYHLTMLINVKAVPDTAYVTPTDTYRILLSIKEPQIYTKVLVPHPAYPVA